MDAPAKKKRGRPPKTTLEVQPENVEVPEERTLQTAPSQIEDIKHVIRTLNWSGNFGEDQSMPSNVIEDHLNQNYFAQGYTLYKAINLNIMESAGTKFGNTMLYILVKYAQ
jgi:hypothetical protein